MAWNDEEMDPKAPRPPRRQRNFVMPLVLLLGFALLVIFFGQNLPGATSEAEISLAEYLEGIRNFSHLIERVDVTGTDGGGTLEATVNDPGWKVKDAFHSRIRVMLPEAALRDWLFGRWFVGVTPQFVPLGVSPRASTPQ